jgi:serine/threonine protein kinase
MGQVYKARDTWLNRTVAIKVLPPEFASRPDWKQRFEREAQTIASLNHPHICTLHDVGQHDGVDYLVMEFLEGQTLAQPLERGASLGENALSVRESYGSPAVGIPTTSRRVSGVLSTHSKPSFTLEEVGVPHQDECRAESAV